MLVREADKRDNTNKRRNPYTSKMKLMVKIEELLEAGVHFGHRVTKWNPRMAPFIFGERNKIHIIDLIQTLHYLNETSNFLKNLKNHVGSPGFSHKAGEQTVLFVGTKKQAAGSIEQAACRVPGSHYVNHRWLGGLLTNWTTMKICIDLLNSLEKGFADESVKGSLDRGASLPNEAHDLASKVDGAGPTISSSLPKKEQAILKKQYQKLNTFFGGIKHMKGLPTLVVIVGQDSEMNAVRECQKLQNNLSESAVRNVNRSPGFANVASNTDGTNGSMIPAKSGTGKPMSRSFSPGSNNEPATSIMPILRTITILDTNCDPQLTDLFIPANDDSTKSIDLILNQLTEALA